MSSIPVRSEPYQIDGGTQAGTISIPLSVRIAKRALDLVLSGVGLLILGLIFPFVALAVRLDSKGPLLYKQRRAGALKGRTATGQPRFLPFEMLKFRTMRVDAEKLTGVVLAEENDPRVTRVGRFIRKTSLDELPQLFNVVFKGNLSLVGPRPHAVHAKAVDRLYDEAVDGYFARHRVKPGITGWAQINGWRGETDNQEKIQRRVEHDLYYIENWSVLFDLYILAMTPFALLKTENAY